MLHFFGYWTYRVMEILKKMLHFFGYWTYRGLDLYGTGLGTEFYVQNFMYNILLNNNPPFCQFQTTLKRGGVII